MAIVKTIPVQKRIHGNLVQTSETSVVSELNYSTSGEDCIIVRGVPESTLILNSKTTEHVVVKSLTKLTIKPDIGKVDEDYDEVIMDIYACVEFRFVNGNWYILSSDGLKQS